MARKYDLISELYRRTAHAVVPDVENWQAFVRCACLLYTSRPAADRRQLDQKGRGFLGQLPFIL